MCCGTFQFFLLSYHDSTYSCMALNYNNYSFFSKRSKERAIQLFNVCISNCKILRKMECLLCPTYDMINIIQVFVRKNKFLQLV